MYTCVKKLEGSALKLVNSDETGGKFYLLLYFAKLFFN